MNTRLNRAYDNLPEPRRFLTFFIPTAVLIIALDWAVGTTRILLTLVLLLVMLSCLLLRMAYLFKREVRKMK